MLIVATRKEWGHLRRWSVAEVGAGVKRRVRRVTGPVDAASNCGEAGGGRNCGNECSSGKRKRGKRSTSKEDSGNRRRLSDGGRNGAFRDANTGAANSSC